MALTSTMDITLDSTEPSTYSLMDGEVEIVVEEGGYADITVTYSNPNNNNIVRAYYYIDFSHDVNSFYNIVLSLHKRTSVHNIITKLRALTIKEPLRTSEA